MVSLFNGNNKGDPDYLRFSAKSTKYFVYMIAGMFFKSVKSKSLTFFHFGKSYVSSKSLQVFQDSGSLTTFCHDEVSQKLMS